MNTSWNVARTSISFVQLYSAATPQVLASLPVMSKEEVGELRADCLHGGVIVATAHLGCGSSSQSILPAFCPSGCARNRSSCIGLFMMRHSMIGCDVGVNGRRALPSCRTEAAWEPCAGR